MLPLHLLKKAILEIVGDSNVKLDEDIETEDRKVGIQSIVKHSI